MGRAWARAQKPAPSSQDEQGEATHCQSAFHVLTRSCQQAHACKPEPGHVTAGCADTLASGAGECACALLSPALLPAGRAT